ncbi:MAG: MFS transporter [Agathobacter sp.]|nr:MFS transporter [Agathobacter sp.]
MTHLLIAIIYLAFISLGLPDAVFGGSWPTMYQEFNVPVSFAGVVTVIISLGTIVSSLMSDRMTYKLGTGKVTAISVATTAVALFGFSMSHSFMELCLWAIPYGLGAGGVDASLNNYVAVHYSSRIMSWLHCMWGLGAMTGPYVLGFVLTNGGVWNTGYKVIALLQVVLTIVLVVSLPLWKKRETTVDEAGKEVPAQAFSMKEILSIKGAKDIMIAFFCYCALEQTAGLWASSYMVLHKGVPEAVAASYASMFYIGITVGRFFSGFLTMKLNDKQMIHLGMSILAIGVLVLFLPLSEYFALAGFILIGIGCAPIYPCIIHSTPDIFGADKSQAIVGVQMASAYTGSLLMPSVFGIIANHITVALLPLYLCVILVVMVVMYERLVRSVER